MSHRVKTPMYPRLLQRFVSSVVMSLEAVIIFVHLLTYLLVPWSRVLLEKLTGSQLFKKFPAFYGTRRFIIALTSARHLSLSWASSIQSIPLHPTSWTTTNFHSQSYSMHKRLLLRVCCNSEEELDPGKEREHLCYINWLSGCYRLLTHFYGRFGGTYCQYWFPDNAVRMFFLMIGTQYQVAKCRTLEDHSIYFYPRENPKL